MGTLLPASCYPTFCPTYVHRILFHPNMDSSALNNPHQPGPLFPKSPYSLPNGAARTLRSFAPCAAAQESVEQSGGFACWRPGDGDGVRMACAVQNMLEPGDPGWNHAYSAGYFRGTCGPCHVAGMVRRQGRGPPYRYPLPPMLQVHCMPVTCNQFQIQIQTGDVSSCYVP